MPQPLDQSRPLLDPEMQVPSHSNLSLYRVPCRPVSIAASATSSSSLLGNEKPSAGFPTPSITPNTNPFAKKFDRRRQFVRLASGGLFRFLLTVVLIGCLYGNFKLYEKHGLIGENGKKVFNTLFTGLSMTLGISVASSFKSIALNVRWWILSRKKRPVEEVNAILACSSLTEVSLLSAKSAKKMKTGLALSCFLWVFFNVFAQAAVAMLGLTYSLNASSDPSKPVPGNVTFTNMTQSFGVGIDTDSTEASQLAVHAYGEMGLEFNVTKLNFTDPSTFSNYYLYPFPTQNYFAIPNSTYFQYVFQETDINSIMGYFYSNRSINTTSNCTVYSVTDNLNGSSQSFEFEKDGLIHTQNFSSIAPNSTTFLTDFNQGDCGPRCANVCAYENNDNKGWYYECTITVSKVSNAVVPEHRVSDPNAKMAAAAIALQGYQAENQDTQYQRFPAESCYGEFLDGDKDRMAFNMGQFAIGVFASADLALSNIDPDLLNVTGLLPDQGLELTIDHPKGMWAIFGGIGGCHLVLFILAVWVANKVIVIDDDYLAIGLLLRPLVEEVKEKGGLLDVEQRERLLSGIEVMYGPKGSEKNLTGGDGVRELEISEEAECERDNKGWEGYFDS